MGILNSIWTFLITSNELNIKLMLIPFTFIEIYIGMALFLNIFNIKVNAQKKCFYVVFVSIISIANNFTMPNPFNIFANYILCFILIILIFKMTPFKAFLSAVSSVSIFALIGCLILNPYITISHITTEELSNIPIYKIIYLMIMYTISFMIIFILKKKKLWINFFEDIDRKNKSMILINFIFGILTLILQTCILFYYVDTLPMIITFLSFIPFLAYFVISIYSLTRVLKLNVTTKKLESAEEYNRTLHILHDNVRGFKHDFDNIVTTIGGYIRTSDMEGLQHYYLQLEDDCQRVNNLYLLNPEIINNPRYL
ncbi:MAG: hypothetical protein HFJ35_00465 [Clostridia bacterium]|nr:hypothetical protein [Clostridia bacterium]